MVHCRTQLRPSPIPHPHQPPLTGPPPLHPSPSPTQIPPFEPPVPPTPAPSIRSPRISFRVSVMRKLGCRCGSEVGVYVAAAAHGVLEKGGREGASAHVCSQGWQMAGGERAVEW
ncbi:hypothetical protein Acr_00g0012050 [Actinidia rufa]|uniref:Uncharacterized protein n=1 Tax=Actinidia rufa TaxID=165716 RepID=A0A7J0DBA8_9ERIC|nr:hypothetical protein Acr_00g0012050 [Actinidia rufa]